MSKECHSYLLDIKLSEVIINSRVLTVKPQIFACPLFHEFCDLSKFTKITVRIYLNGNQYYCITSSSVTVFLF